jgi:hypothetical protein
LSFKQSRVCDIFDPKWRLKRSSEQHHGLPYCLQRERERNNGISCVSECCVSKKPATIAIVRKAAKNEVSSEKRDIRRQAFGLCSHLTDSVCAGQFQQTYGPFGLTAALYFCAFTQPGKPTLNAELYCYKLSLLIIQSPSCHLRQKRFFSLYDIIKHIQFSLENATTD